ncbi:MAG: hypothetical protein ABSH22_15600 [Tepidisphaeraceae bacterium]|jgi:transcriptional regulator
MSTMTTVAQRKFIIDLYHEGHTQTAIANVVGTTQGNVSKVLSRARKRDPLIPARRRTQPLGEAQRARTYAASQLGSCVQPMNLDAL